MEERPATIKGGRYAKYPWETLQKEGDFFELKNCTTTKHANSVRAASGQQSLTVSVLRICVGGHYVVTLLEDRKEKSL